MTRTASVIVLLLAIVSSSVASAQANATQTNVAWAWRVQAETMLLLNDSSAGEAAALWRRGTTSAPLPSGLGAPTLGLGVGYGLFDFLVVGISLGGGYDRATRDSGYGYEVTLSAATLDVAPYVEVMTTGDVWRPFATLSLHYRVENYTVESSPNLQVPPGSASRPFIVNADPPWGGGLALGLHAFLSNAISLDASVRAIFWSHSATVSAQLGLSVWL